MDCKFVKDCGREQVENFNTRERNDIICAYLNLYIEKYEA